MGEGGLVAMRKVCVKGPSESLKKGKLFMNRELRGGGAKGFSITD